MTGVSSTFRVGALYSSDEIQTALAVGNAGGVRVCIDDDGNVRRVAVLTSVPSARQASENPYLDRTEGDVLVYTGAGRHGDQSLAGVNKRLPQQVEDKFPIYGFELIGSRRDESIGPKRWRFIGLLEYLRHYREFQLDARKELRQVWLFEFFIHATPDVVPVESDSTLSQQLLATGNSSGRSTVEDREVVGAGVSLDRQNALEIEQERLRLLAMAPNEFEHAVRDALVATGFERVHVTQYSNDGGIDVNAYASQAMWPVKGLLVQVQAKRWRHTVGRKEVAELRGSLQPFARGAVVTTSHFSRAAIAEAAETGKNPIVLIDGYTFANTHRLLAQKPA